MTGRTVELWPGSENHHLGCGPSPQRSCLLAVSAARPNGLAKVATFIAHRAGKSGGTNYNRQAKSSGQA